MNQPAQQIENDFSDFLKGTKWESFDLIPMSADMGLRRYFRLEKENETALLMDMSRAGILETGLKEFIVVAEFLQKNNVRVPEIYKYDLEIGYAVIENLGKTSFGDALREGVSPVEIYKHASQVLVDINKTNSENVLELGGYKETLIWERLSQFVDYYMPIGAGRKTTQADHEEFQNVMMKIEKTVPPCPMGFCHADYHLENLIWRDNENDRAALIDFQDAFWGFNGYDLLNLLEDARATVPDDIKQSMKALYCENMSAEERQTFDDWYVLMSCHFHCRVIGLFIKFARENGGVEFLEHIPRLQGYIKDNLKNPILAPLKDFMEKHKISLDITVKL